jgi:hypothetical protein
MEPPVRPPIDRLRIAAGLFAMALGSVPLLILGGVIPVTPSPGDPPAPIILGAGVCFILGGLAAVFQALGRASGAGELPPDAPLWRRCVQLGLGLGVLVTIALVLTWGAVGRGDEAFREQIGGVMGRVSFGAGAILLWLLAAFIAYRLVRMAGAKR